MLFKRGEEKQDSGQAFRQCQDAPIQYQGDACYLVRRDWISAFEQEGRALPVGAWILTLDDFRLRCGDGKTVLGHPYKGGLAISRAPKLPRAAIDSLHKQAPYLAVYCPEEDWMYVADEKGIMRPVAK